MTSGLTDKPICFVCGNVIKPKRIKMTIRGERIVKSVWNVQYVPKLGERHKSRCAPGTKNWMKFSNTEWSRTLYKDKYKKEYIK